MEFFEKPADLKKQTEAFLENLKKNIRKFPARPDKFFFAHNLLHDYKIQGMAVTRDLVVTANKVFLAQTWSIVGCFPTTEEWV